MLIDFNSLKPIYIQIAEAIEDDIIAEKLKEEAPVYSQLELSKELNINPATAAKGIQMLVQKKVLVKQRGLPMTVAKGAKTQLLEEKKNHNFLLLAESFVAEAKKLGLEKSDMIRTLEELYEKN